MIESATFWKDGPEIETGEIVPTECRTEVFFLPAASHVEKEGTFTQTQRMLQWREKAVEPPGDAAPSCGSSTTSAGWSGSGWPAPTTRATGRCCDLDLGLPDARRDDEPSAEAVLREINGYGPDRRLLSGFTELKADGSTSCGCWIYCGVFADGVNQAARRKPGTEQDWVAPRVGLGLADEPAHPLQPRLGRPGRQAVERAQGVRLVGRGGRRVDRPRRARLREDQAAVLPAAGGATGPGRARRRRPVHHAGRRQGLAVRAERAASTGRCRRTTSRPSRRAQPALRQQANPTRKVYDRANPCNPSPPEPHSGRLPVRLHHQPAHRAPHGRRR